MCEECEKSAEYDAYGNIRSIESSWDEVLKHYDMGKPIIEKLYDRNVTVYTSVLVHVNGVIGESSQWAIFSYSDEWPYNIMKGRNFTQEDFDNHRRVALISENIEKNVQKKDDGYYIMIDNEYYQVIGIYEPIDNMADVSFAYFPEKENCYSSFCKRFAEGNLPLVFGIYIGFNSGDIAETASNVADVLNEIDGISFWVDSVGTSEVSTDTKIRLLSIVYGLLLFFCIVIYVQVISLFVKKRQRDYIVYRTCGCDNRYIARKIFGEMCPMLICSLAAVFVINSLYNILIADRAWYGISLEGLAFIFVTTVILAYASIFVILMKIKRINLVEGIMDI